MQGASANLPVEDFPNVEPLAKIALTKEVKVDTPDSAPTEDSEGRSQPAAAPANATPAKPTIPITEAHPPVEVPPPATVVRP